MIPARNIEFNEDTTAVAFNDEALNDEAFSIEVDGSPVIVNNYIQCITKNLEDTEPNLDITPLGAPQPQKIHQLEPTPQKDSLDTLRSFKENFEAIVQ